MRNKESKKFVRDRRRGRRRDRGQAFDLVVFVGKLAAMSNPLRDQIRLARSGDRDALDELLGRTQRRLTEIARFRLGGELHEKIHTSDILQSTYLDIVRKIDHFDGDSEDDFVRWFSRVLENNIRDKVRFFGAQRRRRENEVPIDAVGVAATESSPSSDVAFGEELRIYGRALRSLTEEQRTVIQLRLVEGMATADVAERIGRSVGATRVTLSRARASLAMEVARLKKGAGTEESS